MKAEATQSFDQLASAALQTRAEYHEAQLRENPNATPSDSALKQEILMRAAKNAGIESPDFIKTEWPEIWGQTKTAEVPEGVELRSVDSSRAIIKATTREEASARVAWAKDNGVTEITVSYAAGTKPEGRSLVELELERAGWVKNPDYAKYHSWAKPQTPTTPPPQSTPVATMLAEGAAKIGKVISVNDVANTAIIEVKGKRGLYYGGLEGKEWTRIGDAPRKAREKQFGRKRNRAMRLFEEDPFILALNSFGGVKGITAARNEMGAAKFKANADMWEGAKTLAKNPQFTTFYGTENPDTVAQALYEQGLLDSPLLTHSGRKSRSPLHRQDALLPRRRKKVSSWIRRKPLPLSSGKAIWRFLSTAFPKATASRWRVKT